MWTIKYIRAINSFLPRIGKRNFTGTEEKYMSDRLERALRYFEFRNHLDEYLMVHLCLISAEMMVKIHPGLVFNRERIVATRKKLYQLDEELFSSLGDKDEC